MLDFYLETSDFLRAEGGFITATGGIFGEAGATTGLREGEVCIGICVYGLAGLATAPG